MTEVAHDRLPEDRGERYRQILQEIESVLSGESNRTARLATVSALLYHAFSPRFLWCGFYLVDHLKPTELVVGPYQGTLGCLRIPMGRGVCGAAAVERRTIIVPDVHAFPGHIACDSRSLSEIVIPVITPGGDLVGVLDVDSGELAAFDALDQEWLEAVARLL